MHRGAGRSTYDGKIAGLYDLEATLGRGHFAVVKSARHVFTGEKVAVKVIDKSKLDEVSRAHLFQEVRCMKLVQHPNVVRLYEVIDTATKLYLILELGDGGDLYDYIMRHETGLGEDMAREYFRQIVRAISYCHRLHVAHRDLKPENVVFFERLGMVKLTDFGFSNRFNPGQKLETSCGSLAYSAPEILLGDSYDAPAVDVWSLGVILYMLVCGQAPFQEANDSETLTMIMDVKYTMPAHVSDGCRRLIARMLVREPDKRASLQQIASDPWLTEGAATTEPADFLPLISREHVSDEDHALIIQKMSNGNIATKEEILEALDKNEYNHITATYFLLAERKLRAHRQEQATTQQRLKQILPSPMQNSKPFLKVDVTSPQDESTPGVNPTLLLGPARAGDAVNRARKCSIVQEEEDEDDDIPGTGREDLAPPRCSLNRRGSRSEGKLNIALQERLGESERRKDANAIPVGNGNVGIVRVGVRDDSARVKVGTPIWIPAGKRNLPLSGDTGIHPVVKLTPTPVKKPSPPTQLTITSVITESSTISMPLKPSATLPVAVLLPKYKTMPSPTRMLGSPHLNEIFEEGEGPSEGPRQGRGLRAYEQRRTKFHKARTASCSSSDASDDDSESRKKRAHKLTAEGKPLPQRRDSHDDSSDSQDPSGSGGGAGGGGGGARAECAANQPADVAASNTRQSSSSGGGGGGGGGREARQCSGAQPPFSRRHRAGRRRAGETRLRESQSLNRITEVQEAEHPVAAVPTTAPASRPRSFGARLLQGWTSKKTPVEPVAHLEEKENCKLPKTEKKSGKKVRLLSRYFQMHKKLCLPLPGLFGRGRLYKAQSCGSIVRDRVCQQPAAVVLRNGDINQNVGLVRSTPRLDSIVPLVANCPGIAICSIHLGDVTKCCHLC